MKSLKLEELKENTMYRCLISDLPVYVESIKNIDNEMFNGLSITSHSYNKMTGFIQPHFVFDNSLTDFVK